MQKTDLRLVPDRINESPDYYCTWQSQLYASSNAGPQGQRDVMTERGVFGSGDEKEDIRNGIGWAAWQYKRARSDLYLILDDSWDVPMNAEAENGKWYGSLALARDKFPSFYGTDNAEPFSDGEPIDMSSSERAMSRVSERVRALGWKGLGGWVCVQKSPVARLARTADGKVYAREMSDAEYWKEALLRSYRAGWQYWKMDWGGDSGSAETRQTMTELAHRLAPDMWIEHAIIPEVIPTSDTFRSYDAYTLMAIPLTLSRLSELLKYETRDGYRGLINCEDEPYIAAALGCVLGVMRHGMTGALPDGSPDCSFPPMHRNFKSKLNEVLRCVRWHRIAPAYGVNGSELFVDGERLCDNWHVISQAEEIEAWWKYKDGDIIEESAPARISRGIAPTEVIPDKNGYVPYIIASRNPNGAVAIASLGRTEGRRYFVPRCDITQNIGNADTVGLFGFFASVRLECSYKVKRVYMQDLADDCAFDITDSCLIDEGGVTVPGELIEKIGSLCNGDGDTSEPGTVIKIEG